MLDSRVVYIDGLQFVGESRSGHAIVMDADPGVGGKNTGPRPMELLLLGIGGCSGMDVISILQKKKQQVTAFEIIVKAQKAEEYPKKLTDVTLEFVVKGKNISEEAVKRSIDLSMNKYCSVKATLEGSAQITFSYTIIQE